MNSNRFNLIFRIWNLSISYHATWFIFEFVKAQTHMTILFHLTLDDYWCSTHIGILSCSTLIEILSCSGPIVYSVHIVARHLLSLGSWILLNTVYLLSIWIDSTLVEFLACHIFNINLENLLSVMTLNCQNQSDIDMEIPIF